MPFKIPVADVRRLFPGYEVLEALTPSAHKAAFHVRNADGQELCLKLISPDFRLERLHREVEALLQVEHPNVVRFHEYTLSVTRDTQRHYIIEEYVEGTDLTVPLIDESPWELDRTAEFFSAVFRGLSALQAIHVVHRDLKPSNIRVREQDGSPVILDLGLARHLTRSDLTRTSEGAAIGTPAYFAPEQFSGTKHEIDHRTDYFAVGLMLYHALVGRPPFFVDGMTVEALRDRVCGTFNEHLSATEFEALPDEWRLLLTRLLDRHRARRPSEARQVARILDTLGASE